MGSTVPLMPLEFKDCLTDSPEFRRKLHSHEKELDRTSQAIKALTKEFKNLVEAARNLSQAQRNLVSKLKIFSYRTNNLNQTEDEIAISNSLESFAQIISIVEEERQRMLDRAEEQIIAPLENFRKDAIGGAKERRKKFDKQTQKFYQSQERYLNLSTKKDGQVLQEADASLDMEQRHFIRASLEYVFLLQEVQERKKFEFVEIILSHTLSWLTFYHLGHDVYNDYKDYMNDLQERIQRTRENFFATRDEALVLKSKMLDINDPGSMNKMYTRQGYLFLMEKKAFGTTWTKWYCYYQKDSREFKMTSYNQIQQKMIMTLKSCVRRSSDSIDKRFCLDLTVQMHDKEKIPQILTLQTLSDEDCKKWMDAMDGKEPVYSNPSLSSNVPRETTSLDESGLSFITRAIEILERKGLEDQGLYRLVGVSSKVNKLLSLGLDPTKCDTLSLEDPAEWEVKTITSAIKQYFRNLPEPLMTYKMHSEFINSAKKEKLIQRVAVTHALVHRLPKTNFIVLKTLMEHLCNVAKKSDKNLMTVSNLGVCFGPTLLRPEEESVAAIMDIKFCNIVVEILIEHFDKIFNSAPSSSMDISHIEEGSHHKHSSSASSSSTPKSSPRPTSQSPSSQITSQLVTSKANQPVLQTVVTSFTTSEPQTVHFGSGNQPTGGSQHNLLRSEATSNLKTPNVGAVGNHHLHHYGSRPPGGIPPPPSSTHLWGAQSASTSSLNSGINSHPSLSSLTSAGPGSLYDIGCTSNNNVGNNVNIAKPSRPSNGRLAGGPPLSFINPLSGGERGEGVGSSSSSCESLSSRSSRDLPHPASSLSSSSSPQTSKRFVLCESTGNVPTSPHHNHHHLSHLQHYHHQHHPLLQNGGLHRDRLTPTNNHYSLSSSVRLGTAYPPTYRQHMETTTLSGSLSSSALPTLASACAASVSSVLTGSATANGIVATSPPRKKVRTLYACVGENESELSFEPNQILTNVRPSKEPGWLEGSLNGRSGLIPENYVEVIDDKGSLPTLLSQRNTDV